MGTLLTPQKAQVLSSASDSGGSGAPQCGHFRVWRGQSDMAAGSIAERELAVKSKVGEGARQKTLGEARYESPSPRPFAPGLSLDACLCLSRLLDSDFKPRAPRPAFRERLPLPSHPLSRHRDSA